MRAQPIREAHTLRPFKPVVIRTESGGSRPVNHPEPMGRTVDGATVLLGAWSEMVALIEVASITEISRDSNTEATS
jgi:hypothetical protein